MKTNESYRDNEPDELPEVGERFDIWHAGHVPVDCISHNADRTINVRMPDGDVVVAECVFGSWMANLG